MGRKVPSINTSSSADISFLLLTFFLLTSNISTDQGIMQLLPKKKAENTTQVDVEINTRNLLRITVTNKNIVMVEGAKWTDNNWVMLTDDRSLVNSTNSNNYGGEISQLYEIAYDFFSNEKNDPNLPETKSTLIEDAKFGDYPVSCGVISLECQNGATYETYIKVHNELTRAVNDLRNKLSKDKFGKPYKVLEESSDESDKEKVKALKKAIPMNISEPSKK
jgi:biopolymer transport protein ExbD